MSSNGTRQTPGRKSLSVSTERNLIILSLILVCVALMATIVILDVRLRAERSALLLLDKNLAHNIEITHAKYTLQLNRQDEQWTLTQPDGDQEPTNIDSSRVAPLLSLLQLPNSGRYNIDEVDRQLLGLEQPSAHLKINDISILLGKPASENRRYVQVNDTVYLAPDFAYPLIASGPPGFTGTASEPPKLAAQPDDAKAQD